MLDVNDGTGVAEASRRFGFVNPAAGRIVGDLPAATRLLVVRAGRDEVPGVNASIDGFVTAAIHPNLSVSVVNHPSGPHAFDIVDDTAASGTIVRDVLGFLRVQLRGE